MTLAAFDTLGAVRNLEEAGMDTAQAEAVTRTIRAAASEGAATAADLSEFQAEVRTDIAGIRGEMDELRGEMAELRAEVRTEIAALRGEMGELRGEMAELRAEVRTDIAGVRGEMGELRADMRAEMEKLRADLTWRVVLVVGALLTVATAVDRLLG